MAKAKRVQSTEMKVADARRLSFRTFAQRWVDETLFYRSGAYVAQTVRWLDVYVYPAIGDMQLDEVQPGDVLAIIKARADTAVTAERIRALGFDLASARVEAPLRANSDQFLRRHASA